MKRSSGNSGFTLVELMIAVAILGVLAASAVPAFTTYLRRAKTSDAYSTLDAMFKSASAYYNRDFADTTSIDSVISAHCTVSEASSFPGPPTDHKQAFVSTSEFSDEIGIAFPPGYSYYKFTNVRADAGDCGGGPRVLHYLLTANGDLDADTVMSTFSLATMSSASNELYKAGGVYVQNELE